MFLNYHNEKIIGETTKKVDEWRFNMVKENVDYWAFKNGVIKEGGNPMMGK